MLRRFSIPVDQLAARGSVKAGEAVAAKLMEGQTTSPQYPPPGFGSSIQTGYRNNAVLRRCVDILARNFQQAHLTVRDASSKVEVPSHALTELLRRGGRMQSVPGVSESTLWTRFVQDVYLCGNALWEKVWSLDGTRVVEVWRLDPRRVAIVPDEITGIARYLYQVGGKWYPLKPQSVVHWMFPDPLQPYFGIPPIYSALRDLAVDNDLTDHLKVTLQNYGIPAMALIHEATLSTEDADEAREVLARVYSGKNKNRVGIFGGGPTIQVLGLNMKDLAIGDLVATTESRIAMVHGVPMILLGRSGTQADPTRANYAEAKEHLWFDTMLPLLGEVAGLLTSALLPAFADRAKSNLVAEFDTSGVAVLQMAKLQRAEKASILFDRGLVSRRTAQRLGGIAEQGPDVFYRPSSVGAVIQLADETETIEPVEE